MEATHPRLGELKPGQAVNGLAVRAVGACCKPTKNGDSVRVQLADADSIRSAVMWSSGNDVAIQMDVERFIRVFGRVGIGQYEGQITIESWVPVEDDFDKHSLLPGVPADHRMQADRFQALLRQVQDKYLRKLLVKIFGKNTEVMKDFYKAVAGAHFHHAYPGGLLEHSVEVAELCLKACDVLPNLSRDLLITAALLHDIGKLDEIEHDLLMGEYTAEGSLVGHVVSGAIRIRAAAAEIPDFPQGLRLAVEHLILSHMGKPEYGAAREASLTEALVLASCDALSAKAFQFREAAKNVIPRQFSVKTGAGRVYLGDLGLPVDPAGETDGEASEYSDPFEEWPTSERRFPGSLPNTQFQTVKTLPYRGCVSAGTGEMAETFEEEREAIVPKGGANFLLRVSGDSMTRTGIFDNDILMVNSEKTPRAGDIVVAFVEGAGEVVKRFRTEQNSDGETESWLDSESLTCDYPSLHLQGGSKLQGVVTGVQRDL